MSKIFIENGIPTLAPNDLDLSKKEWELVDVRTDSEFTGELGHIEGAKLLTLGSPELNQFLTSSPKANPVVFICRSGGRSGQATALAISYGFKNCVNLQGGMILWNELGLPTAR